MSDSHENVELSEPRGVVPDPSGGPAAAATSPAKKPTRSKQRNTGMFQDPVVKVMAWVVAAIVVGALLSIVSLLYFGYLNRGEGSAPRTYTERMLNQNESLISNGAADPETWHDYVVLLISAKQYAKAQTVIDDGKGVVDDTWGQELLWVQAELYAAQEKYDLAIKTADEAQAKIMEAYNTELASPALPNKATSWGVSPNYGELSLLKAKIYIIQKKPADAQKELQAYVDSNPDDAGILIDLANLKLENGDKEGARADYEKAAQFLPDDPEVIAGLEKTGAK